MWCYGCISIGGSQHKVAYFLCNFISPSSLCAAPGEIRQYVSLCAQCILGNELGVSLFLFYLFFYQFPCSEPVRRSRGEITKRTKRAELTVRMRRMDRDGASVLSFSSVLYSLTSFIFHFDPSPFCLTASLGPYLSLSFSVGVFSSLIMCIPYLHHIAVIIQRC